MANRKKQPQRRGREPSVQDLKGLDAVGRERAEDAGNGPTSIELPIEENDGSAQTS